MWATVGGIEGRLEVLQQTKIRQWSPPLGVGVEVDVGVGGGGGHLNSWRDICDECLSCLGGWIGWFGWVVMVGVRVALRKCDGGAGGQST